MDDRAPAGVSVRPLVQEDWPAVHEIYRQGIREGATFATDAPSWEEWDAAHTLRVVASEDDEVLGWAALSPISPRHVYRGVGRDAVYVAAKARGHGIGRRLMDGLIEAAEREGIWTLEAWMFPENSASVELHKRCGFRVVGVRERIGQRDGVWRDVVLMERRSKEVS
jgi:phosphinothricin acetyltransferase